MVNIFSRKCRIGTYSKCAPFGMVGTKTAEYCAQHALALAGWSTYEVESTEPKAAASYRSTVLSTHWRGWSTPITASAEPRAAASFHLSELQVLKEYCAQHALDGMINLKNKKCRTEDCGKLPSFGVAGTKSKEYCAHHALDGMVNVKNRQCRTEGCGKLPSFGVAGKGRTLPTIR